MKINLIVDKNSLDSQTDANIVGFLFRKIKDKTDFKMVDVNNFKCEKASVNIFFGCINNLLLDFAKSNILIPSQNSFLSEWAKQLEGFDLVLCKTRYIEEIFRSYVDKEKLKYIGWRSTDLYSNIDKNYDNFLLFVHNNKFVDYKKIIDSWEPDFPMLNIINGNLFNVKKEQSNINYLGNLTQSEFERVVNENGIHICLNQIESFSHSINQCCLVKSIPLIIDKGPMKEIVNDDICFTVPGKKKPLNNLLGSKYDYNSDSLKSVIKKIAELSETTLEIMGKNARIHAVKNQDINSHLFKDIMSEHLKMVRSKSMKKEVKLDKEKLPKVTLITLTRNRKHLFKLAVYNYKTSTYPKDKLEWLIYDTSNDEEKVEDFLPPKEEREKLNISYYHDNSLKSIGESRNKSCELAKNEIIVFMDDDDYYFPESVVTRVNSLVNSGKQIIGVRILASLSITKVISYINTSGIYSSIRTSISPATLCFYKSILSENVRFTHENINECEDIFKNIDLGLFKEISWENVIVALAHKNNITNRNVPNQKPNGCHYGFSDKLLKFILELDD
tara:strand:- start:2477 stop:4153 length:1677 start_codon:yes stop_codon:yes gene_type:complete